MIAAYGYNRSGQALRDAGAEEVWVDFTRERPFRKHMTDPGRLRNGDTLILHSMNDLGGSPKANAKWQGILDRMGVTIRVVPLDCPPKKQGRPTKFEPTPAQDKLLRALWDDERLTSYARVADASGIMERPVTYDQLYYRYVTAPKAQNEEG